MTASNHFLATSNTILDIQMYTNAKKKIDSLKLTSDHLQKLLLKTLQPIRSPIQVQTEQTVA